MTGEDADAMLYSAAEQAELRALSPAVCRQHLLSRFEDLANQLAAGWKYHVANTDGIKESWTRFEDYSRSICSFTEGRLKFAV